MRRETIVALGVLLLGAVLVAACAGGEGAQGPPGPQGPEGPAGPQGPPGAAADMAAADLSCTECHNDSTLITSKQTFWSESRHGSGGAFARGTSASCAGCHSGGAFSERIAAGLSPAELESGDPNPTRQDCRACHQIHTTFTAADFALEITDPVTFYAIPDSTYDGGDGNLCVNCHQPRRDFPTAEDGVISGISSHWGPHHGPQSAMLLGVGGSVEGSPSAHYSVVEDTCIGCHMGPDRVHTFEPEVANCQACHQGAEDFDINGVQTQVQALLDQVGDLLVAEGVLSDTTADGHPIVTEAPENVALALWNWIYVAHEDQSLGVHNSDYAIALLEAALEALGQ